MEISPQQVSHCSKQALNLNLVGGGGASAHRSGVIGEGK